MERFMNISFSSLILQEPGKVSDVTRKLHKFFTNLLRIYVPSF